jgi:hypothetical protein
MKYSEIFFVIRKFLAYTPAPKLYMLATALGAWGGGEGAWQREKNYSNRENVDCQGFLKCRDIWK